MITATSTEARRAVDLLAIQTAMEAITIADCTGDPQRVPQHIESAAILYADRLAEGGLDLFEAQSVADHFLQAATWCLASTAQLPDELIADAVDRASRIAEVTGDCRAASQVAMYAALSAVQEMLPSSEWDAFAERAEKAVEAAARPAAGCA